MIGLRLALGFLTILPGIKGFGELTVDLKRAASWFSLVGCILGGLVALSRYCLGVIFPLPVASVLALGIWVFLSGGLHLDGLADCWDGMLVEAPAERRLEILRDSRLGTFAVVGLFLHLTLKTTLLFSLPLENLPLILIFAASLARWFLLPLALQPQARPGGLGAAFSQAVQRRQIVVGALLPLGLMVWGGWLYVLAALAAALLAWFIARLAQARLCGMTGDVLGLAVESLEVVVMLVFSLKFFY